MSLFPDKDSLSREIESWKGFVMALRGDDKRRFERLLEVCYKYAVAIGTKPESLSTEALLMAIILEQERAIQRLEEAREGK
jgi:hypothetical protein